MNLSEGVLRWVVAAAAGLVLVSLVQGVVRSHRRPPGRTTAGAERVLRPGVETLIGVGFLGVCIVLWSPLPFEPRDAARLSLDVAGAVLAFTGLGLVLWGRLTLGRLYGVSSALGAQLHGDHRLITHGPFAYTRHPMYLGIETASLGGLLLYRTWTLVFLTVAFLGLLVRARREDELLRLEFGAQWEAYRQHVPGWLPRTRRTKPFHPRD